MPRGTAPPRPFVLLCHGSRPALAFAAPISCFLLLGSQEVDDRFMDTVQSLSEKLKFTSTSGGPTGGFARGPGWSPDSAAGRASGGAGAGAGSGAGLVSGAPLSPASSETIRLEDLGVAPSETLAGRDALPELERLRVKTVTRVRSVFVLLCAPAVLERAAPPPTHTWSWIEGSGSSGDDACECLLSLPSCHPPFHPSVSGVPAHQNLRAEASQD